MTMLRWIALGLGFATVSSLAPGLAYPADVFTPYLSQIRQVLPADYEMRLPNEILLGGPGMDPEQIRQLIVRVTPILPPEPSTTSSSTASDTAVSGTAASGTAASGPTAPQIIVSLFTCDHAPYPCFVGSFAVESARSSHAQQALQRHQLNHAPITLAPGIEGYLLEGDRRGQGDPSADSDYSSVMWTQKGMIYTVRFLASERQNILYMARSMVIHAPLQPIGPAELLR